MLQHNATLSRQCPRVMLKHNLRERTAFLTVRRKPCAQYVTKPAQNFGFREIFYLAWPTTVTTTSTRRTYRLCAQTSRPAPQCGRRFFSTRSPAGPHRADRRPRSGTAGCDAAGRGRRRRRGRAAGYVTRRDRPVGRVARHPASRRGGSATRRCAGRVGVVSLAGSRGESFGPPRPRRRSAPGNRAQSGAGAVVCEHRPRRRPRARARRSR